MSRAPTKTTFIGNISYDLTEDALKEFMGEVGPVKSVRLVSDRDTGKPKGYGFCEYFDIATAESAVRNLNGRDIGARSIRIDFADEGPRSSDGPPGGRGQGQEPPSAAPPPPAADGVDEVSNVLAQMSRQQLWDLLDQTKTLLMQNHQQARQMLINNPALTKAIFQAQIILGLVKAPQIIQAPAAMPVGMPQQYGSSPPGMMAGGPPGGMNGGARMAGAGMPVRPPFPYQQGVPVPPPPQQQSSPGPARPAQPQVNMEQQAILQQLLSLTPSQIDMLPPEQKQQVLAVKRQMGMS